MIFKKVLALYILLFASSIANAATANFISIADIHFDPFVSCNNVTPCTLIVALENSSSSQWPAILKALDTKPQNYKQDTNYTLLTTALAGFKQVAAQQQPKFVVVLGDMLGHNYQAKYNQFSQQKSAAGYTAFVKKTLEFLTHELKQTFPQTPVYMTVGNNDSYSGDYVSEPGGAFFSDTGQRWASLLPDKNNAALMQTSFATAGYYALTLAEQPGLRLIVLNTNLFSAKAQAPETAGQDEFNWLEQELADARTHQQRILLIMHIPAGIDVYASLKQQPFKITEFWRHDYTERFKQDLTANADNIMGILSAHIHSDSYQILGQGAHKILFSSTASISPVNGNNPGFKLFSYQTQGLILQDFISYYLPLATMVWHQEYDFNAVYQPACVACTLATSMQVLPVMGDLAERYQFYYDTETNTDPIHTNWHPYYWCPITSITASDYQQCLTALSHTRHGAK